VIQQYTFRVESNGVILRYEDRRTKYKAHSHRIFGCSV